MTQDPDPDTVHANASSELSSNSHHPLQASSPVRVGLSKCRSIPSGLQSHPSMTFDDGNIAILAGSTYFVIHKGVLCRHSTVLAERIANIPHTPPLQCLLEGRPSIELDEPSEDVSLLLHTVYDGISSVLGGADIFHVGYVLLRLAAKYDIPRLRFEALKILDDAWPASLAQWDLRTKHCVSKFDEEIQPSTFPHPIAVINLARLADVPRLLPAAFYDLSREHPSICAAGFSDTRIAHHLSTTDLIALFQGRESASRFLSTFVVQVLEGRTPNSLCSTPRICQTVFERVTQEVIREITAVATEGWKADPLEAMARVMTLCLSEGEEQGPAFALLCVSCAEALEEDVQSGREMFWDNLPDWFKIEGLAVWGTA